MREQSNYFFLKQFSQPRSADKLPSDTRQTPNNNVVNPQSSALILPIFKQKNLAFEVHPSKMES